MTDFEISFENPWLLFALIPALALTFYTYFRLNKKYRKTRNRIVSVVLHVLVTVMLTCLLAGMTFKYNIKNDSNNVLFVVDVSDTTAKAEKERDDFLKMAIGDCADDGYKVGVVTFGYNQIYAAPIQADSDEVYSQYLTANVPDTTATDIASALTYAKEIIVKGFDPATSKIVLVTDGKETDGDALSIIRSVVSTGIKFNTVYIDENVSNDGTPDQKGELQIVDITFPERHIDINEEFELKVLIKSKLPGDADIELFDNGTEVKKITDANVPAGEQEIKIPHSYATQGLHELECRITITKENGDVVEQNNKFITYHMVESYNKVLILESIDGQSEKMRQILTTDDAFDVTVMSIKDTEKLPKTVDTMRQYDQVIMNNIANGDMPVGFIEIMYSYVSEYGGNMLTVGGLDETGTKEHAYNKNDMMSTKYQEMLPVQVTDYTPPVAAFIILDVSGSMSSYIEDAKEGARSIVTNAMTEKDYIGIMTLSQNYEMVLPLTKATERERIEASLDNIKMGGSTMFKPVVQRAAQALNAQKDVEKRHIIIVTDGANWDAEDFLEQVKVWHSQSGITFSIVLTDNASGTDAVRMAEAAKYGGGSCYSTQDDSITTVMREDIKAKMVNALETVPEGFVLTVQDTVSSIMKDVDVVEYDDDGDGKIDRREYVLPKMYGYFGVKARDFNDTVLSSLYNVPLYSQWRFGEGSVGSFMCDLNGTWSAEFMEDNNGKKIILNIVKNLMPIENIRPQPINFSLTEDNYTNRLSLTSPLQNGEKYQAEIQKVGSQDPAVNLNEMPDSDIPEEDLVKQSCYVKANLKAESDYSKATFVVKDGGTYKLTIKKVDADDKEICRVEVYRTFSYSAEYDEFLYSTVDMKDSLTELAEKGGGSIVEDNSNPQEVLAGFVTKLSREYDPRYLFAILSILMFLLDIVVRKFKWKWPHEIIRDKKAAQLQEGE